MKHTFNTYEVLATILYSISQVRSHADFLFCYVVDPIGQLVLGVYSYREIFRIAPHLKLIRLKKKDLERNPLFMDARLILIINVAILNNLCPIRVHNKVYLHRIY